MTQNDGQARAASELLWTHWQAGTRLAALPPEFRPQDRSAGYAIQACLEHRSDSPLYGWKIAATSAAGQRHIGVDGPLAGRLLAERVYADGDTLPFGGNAMRVIEAEFAFRMADTLPPRDEAYSSDEVLDAVAAMHLAIEVPDSRYQDFASVGAPQLIADNACAHDFVLGPEATGDWRTIDLAKQRVSARVEGPSGSSACEGHGANVLGDPRIALVWLANELSDIGEPLRAGQVVTTGTCIVPAPIAAGDRVDADFGDFGSVSLRFT